jgi:aromatic-L-amino-acid decarboxylase
VLPPQYYPTLPLSCWDCAFVPLDLPNNPAAVEPYLNDLNEELLNRLQRSGEAFISNAVAEGKYLLRACIVNFRTTFSDVEALPEIVIRLGRKVDSEIRPGSLKPGNSGSI